MEYELWLFVCFLKDNLVFNNTLELTYLNHIILYNITMFTTIKNFSQMLQISNGLYVFDIDETFLVFRNMSDLHWEIEQKKLMKIYNDPVKVEKMMFDFFDNILKTYKYKPTDLEGFKKIEKQNKLLNNDIIFLTARPDIYRDITNQHLKTLHPGINYEVYFSETKGDKLNEILEASERKYEEIIFVDDKESNLNDVKEKVKNVKCYRFNPNEYIINFDL